MPSPTHDPLEEFDKAVADLDFERARQLAEGSPGPQRTRLREQLRTRQLEATDRAEKLAARIQFLARADHYEALLALDDDPATGRLLALLPTELQRGAQLHLDGAVRRQKRFRSAAGRHMKAARAALAMLDTAKAASELDKVQTRWLTESQKTELAELRHQADQADAERRELEDRTAEVLRELAPEPASDSPGKAEDTGRKNRIPRIGCLGSSLVTGTLLATLLAGIAN